MRAEIIIACRGELPANLLRTIQSIEATKTEADGICVVLDGEDQLAYNMPISVRVETPWMSPRGPGQARHWGITTSVADIVILVDGHMEFPEGWIDAICGHLKNHKKDVTCAHMLSLTHAWQPIGKPYSGAFIGMKCHAAGDQYVGLGAMWNVNPVDHGPVGAPMGACYGLTRKFYDQMGQPLRILEAWGGDEELLGACAWLCGGRAYLLPIVCRHIYAAPHASRTIDKEEELEIWANRMAILDVLIEDTAMWEDLHAWTQQSAIDWYAVGRALDRRGPAIDALTEHLRAKRRKWSGFVKAGLARELTDAERQTEKARPKVQDQARRSLQEQPGQAKTQPARATNIVTIDPVICPACSSLNTLRRQSGMRKRGSLLEAHAKCSRCGHKVKLRQTG